MIADLPSTGHGLLALYTVCMAAIFVIYAEEIYFLVKNFQPGQRLTRTAWIISFWPVGFTFTFSFSFGF